MRGAVILLILTSGCSRCGHPTAGGPFASELEALRPRYGTAMVKARVWLDNLRVDPVELRERGIKGKKKLVEQLDAYYRLWQVATEAQRVDLRQRIREVVAVTREDRYHDMATVDDLQFKQDATSYLRAAVLMERLDLDTRRYREEIRKIHARLDAHLPQRGPHQRRVFHWYYDHFGLVEPFPLGSALEAGVIARRLDPARLTGEQVYALTHEVYGPYEYGDLLAVDPFDADAKAYLREAVPFLIRRYVAAGDPDLAGELVECLHYLRFDDSPAYLEGVRYLLEAQNDDGSWGGYERQRRRLGDWVKQGFVLHTTLVAIGALTAVFERPMPPAPPEEDEELRETVEP